MQGIFMCKEPEHKSARVFVDGQNLYHQAKEAYGYYYPNYDVLKLSHSICRNLGYSLCGVHFYTGIPLLKHDELWANFWNRKLSRMSRQVNVFSLPLKYSTQIICEKNRDGILVEQEVQVGREKGIDIRIAIDLLKACRNGSCNVIIVFSQDQDLHEAVREAKAISKTAERWLKLVSAFPVSNKSTNIRGINNTQWYKIEREEYDLCLDERIYFESSSVN